MRDELAKFWRWWLYEAENIQIALVLWFMAAMGMALGVIIAIVQNLLEP